MTSFARWGAGFAGVALALAALWAGENAFHHEPSPAPLFTEGDLPALPPPADNGWSTFQAGTKVSVAEVPPDLRRLCAPAEEPRSFSEVVAQAGPVAHFVADSDRSIQLLESALAQPAFADACGIGVDAHCSYLPLLAAHQAVELAVLHRALQGHWNHALGSATALLRGDAGLLSSFRTFASEAIAMAGARRSVALASLLAAGLTATRGEATREPLAPGATGALLAAVTALGAANVDLRRSVIAEHLLAARAVEAFAAGTLRERLLLDPGQTLRLLDERTAAAAAFAEAPETAPPPVVRLRSEGATWWLHNALGKQMLDATAVDFAVLLRKANEDRRALTLAAGAVSAQLRRSP